MNYFEDVIKVVFSGRVRKGTHPDLGEVFYFKNIFFPADIVSEAKDNYVIFKTPLEYWHESGLVWFHMIWNKDDWKWTMEEKLIEEIYLSDGTKIYPSVYV